MKNRLTEISLLRAISMLMIILCHIANFYEQSWLSQFLNVGVYIFLIISGYLYSKKTIDRPQKWIVERWKKLCIPVLIWVTAVFIASALLTEWVAQPVDIVLFALNMQGVSWIIPSFPSLSESGPASGLGHLWFVTIIMLCYIVLIIIKTNKKLEANITNILAISIAMFLLLSIAGINIVYIIPFLIGIILGKREHHYNKKNVIMLTVFILSAIAIRLIGKHFLDGTNYYNLIIVGATHTVIATCIFILITTIARTNKLIKRISSSKTVNFFDRYSFLIYITHNIFLTDFIGLDSITNIALLQILLFTISTIVSTFLLKKTNEIITKTV